MRRRFFLLIEGLLVIGCAFGAQAATCTWTGSESRDWHTAGNWSGNAVPEAGDDVLVNAGATVTLAAATADLGSFTMGGGILVFTNWSTRLQAQNVAIQSGTITLPAAYLNGQMSNRVWIVAGTNFALASGAVIDASAAGYLTSNGVGAGSSYTVAKTDGGGAGHAGRGGRGSNPASMPGGAYGSLTEPVSPGSGGGGAIPNGGYGGGVVRIEAGHAVNVDGTVLANGRPGTASAGGGSGGSIYIQCATFGGAASGLIGVNGGHAGNPASSGGGSGGRVAVQYAALANPCAVRFTARPGTNGWADVAGRHVEHWHYRASWGTLYVPDAQLLDGGLQDWRFDCVEVWLGAATWTPSGLAVSNCALRLASSNLDVTVAGGLLVDTGAVFGFRGPVLRVGADVVVTNGGQLEILCGGTNLPGTDYGQLVAVTGAIDVSAGSILWDCSDPLSGGSPLLRAGALTVLSNGMISARARGYAGDRGPGVGAQTPSWRTGSGHGGGGGMVNYPAARGSPYGSVGTPSLPGSGGPGGTWRSVGGGGLIRIEADDVRIDGTLDADGGGVAAGGGGGAGGAILIRCQRLGGDGGMLSVRGGEGASTDQGGGGGGRMAMHYQQLASTHRLTFRASPGRGWGNTDPATIGWFAAASAGTLYLPDASLLDAQLTDGRFVDVQLFMSNTSSWSVAGDLTVSNTSFYIGSSNFTLSVAGDMTVDGSLAGIGEYGTLSVGGNLRLVNRGALRVDAGAAPMTLTNWGSLVDIRGTLSVGSNCWVYPHAHPTNGASPLFRLGGLSVAANGGFDAIARGFMNGRGPGAGRMNNAATNAYKANGGGGHGGRGGNAHWMELAPASPGVGGATNDSALVPVYAGSAGRGQYGDASSNGRGGGAVRLDINGSAAVDGTLAADGGKGLYFNLDGGGAGGSILVRCSRRLAGGAGASLTARGAPAGADGGGGGGGRIAVWQGAATSAWDRVASGTVEGCETNSTDPHFAGLLSVTNGSGWENATTNASEVGTVVFLTIPPPPGMMIHTR